MTMTTSITSRQRDQVGDVASAAAKKAVDNLQLDGDAAQLVIMRGDQLGTAITEAIRRLSLGTRSHDRAREIMGRNMFGVEEATKHFGVQPSKKDLADLATIPYSETVLTSCKDSHILVAVFPLSLLDVRKKAPTELFYTQDWYDNETFAKDKGGARWYLLRKTPVEQSTSKTWEEQQRLLGKDEETPTVRVVVYTMIGHFLATGERLFEKLYVRCSDVDSLGLRVGVGDFAADGLLVGDRWDGSRRDDLGVASARKFDN
jgi:hypothetical protein